VEVLEVKTFLSVDPGKRILGWALWENRRLVAAGLSECKEADAGVAWLYHQQNLRARGMAWEGQEVVAERMSYRGVTNQARVEDLLDLQLIGGKLGTVFLRPNEWMGGSIDRETAQNRTWALLDAEEREILLEVGELTKTGKVHNAWSAVGIGVQGVLKRKLERVDPLDLPPRKAQSRLKRKRTA
jgi:hypothetical protein